MQYQIDVAHILGQVGKWLIVLTVFGFSITLSYMFFLAIAPPDKPWFPLAGLSLTEGGFLVWMFVFRMIRYHPVHKSIALLMTLACALCSLVVAGFEFYGLLANHFDLLTNPLVAQYVSFVLIGIFIAHFVSLIAELLVGEHQKNPFIQRGGVQPAYAIQEQRGESAAPLASKRHDQPKSEPATFDQEAEIETPQIEEQLPIDELIGAPKNLKSQRNPLPVQSPVKRPPPLQMHEGDSFPEVLKEGMRSLSDGVKSLFSRNRGEKQ